MGTALGPQQGHEYIRTPYKRDWAPLEDRRWAIKYVQDDGSENYTGFAQEFRRRYPLLFQSGGAAWMPDSVQTYLRHDSVGRRLDVDWDLASVPLTEEEKRAVERVRGQRKRRRRLQALQDAGIEPIDQQLQAEQPAEEEKPPEDNVRKQEKRYRHRQRVRAEMQRRQDESG